MTRCPFASSGCNGPIEGECVGLCLHRAVINTETMTRPVVVIKGKVEELPVQFAEPEPNTFTDAFDAYKAHRPQGRMCAIRRSVRFLIS